MKHMTSHVTSHRDITNEKNDLNLDNDNVKCDNDNLTQDDYLIIMT